MNLIIINNEVKLEKFLTYNFATTWGEIRNYLKIETNEEKSDNE